MVISCVASSLQKLKFNVAFIYICHRQITSYHGKSANSSDLLYYLVLYSFPYRNGLLDVMMIVLWTGVMIHNPKECTSKMRLIFCENNKNCYGYITHQLRKWATTIIIHFYRLALAWSNKLHFLCYS